MGQTHEKRGQEIGTESQTPWGVASAQVALGRVESRSDASKVGHGALAGAILGRVFGGGGAKGAVIGAAAGAAAGAAGARADTQYEGCLPKGAMVRMRLTGPLTVGT